MRKMEKTLEINTWICVFFPIFSERGLENTLRPECMRVVSYGAREEPARDSGQGAAATCDAKNDAMQSHRISKAQRQLREGDLANLRRK